jgi:type VI secretion system secreted protein Hcp
MGLNSFAALTYNGTALSGDVTMTSVGGVDVSADHIELYEVQWGTRVGTEGQSHRASAHRRILPIRLMKRVDGTTPELYQALTTNATIAGDIKIFDTNPEDGTTRHRFTITIAGARILAIESRSPDAFDADQSNRPPYEVLELVPHTITYTDVVNSKEYTDEWSTAV